MIHLLGIAATTAGIILCTVLPFLPGRYDPLAVPLSMMAQLFGRVGLLLVPLGILWGGSEYFNRPPGVRRAFAVAALIGVSIVGLIVSLGAFLESLALGIGSLAVLASAVWRLFPRRGAMVIRPARTINPGALYLFLVPVAVASIQIAVADPMVEFSRSRAIRNSAALIADIDTGAANGRYPPSLVSVNKDYWPSVIGIRDYLYEPSGDAYNLLFEQITFGLGIREIVMYNPLDQQVMTSHAMDVLQLTPAQLRLDRTRGHNAVHAAAQPHWKYLWFD